MGLRVFDFKCEFCGQVTEEFVEADVAEIPCPARDGSHPRCGHSALRQIAAPRAQLEGLSGAFPGAAMAWERTRNSHMAKERKNQEKHGTYK
jgi:hypothetical protein